MRPLYGGAEGIESHNKEQEGIRRDRERGLLDEALARMLKAKAENRRSYEYWKSIATDPEHWGVMKFLAYEGEDDRIITILSSLGANAGAAATLAAECRCRMDAVVDAAVEWHQAGREGAEWFDKAETLGAAIDALLELRESPRIESRECPCGTIMDAFGCPNGH